MGAYGKHGLFKLIAFSQFHVSGVIHYIMTLCVLYIDTLSKLIKTKLLDLTLIPFS